MNCYLTIDISKMRLKIISATLRGDRIFTQEIHRYSKITTIDSSSQVYLNVERVIKEIKKALININQIGYKVESISINSSINSPVFLDENNNLLNEIYVDQNIRSIYTNRIRDELGDAYVYRKTGVNYSDNSFICKVLMYRDMHKSVFNNMRKIVSLSDYIGYVLTGNLYNERVCLGLSQIFNFNHQRVDEDILSYLGIKDKIEFNLIDYGEIIGECMITGGKVIAPYGNNFLSSILSTDITNKNSIFIINSHEGIIGCTEDFSKMYLEGSKFNLNHQLLNESMVKIFKYIPCYKLVDGFLRNVENNFMIDNIWDIVNEYNDIDYIIDFDSDMFKNSTVLMNIVRYYFDFRLNSMPNSISDFIRIVYNSFSVYYKKCIRDFEKITGGIFESICIVGDYNSNSAYNQFISDITLKNLEIGPRDSGVIGNLINQLVSLGVIKDFSEVYGILKNSFEYKGIKYSGKKISYKYLENII